MAKVSRPRRVNGHNGDHPDIVVIGASAGGVTALMEIVAGLPVDLDASLFVVIHTSPSSPGILPQLLNREGPIKAAFAEDGERIRRGRIYVAPADHHILIKSGRVQVTRGPKENGFRPAVDPLFRTAAESCGPRVIGVILSGGLDDGTSGLAEIKRRGGLAVVQDPVEAVFPSMPQSAILNVEVDHVVTLAQVAGVIVRLVTQRVGKKGVAAMPRSNGDQPDIAEVGSENLEVPNITTPPSAFTCPECGGALWEVQNDKPLRFRCHLGHGYTGDGLSEHQGKHVESALWTAMRALEESAAFRRRLAERTRRTNLNALAARYEVMASESEQRVAIIRSLLVKDDVEVPARPLRPSPRARERAGNIPQPERPPPRRAQPGKRTAKRKRAATAAAEDGQERQAPRARQPKG